MRALFNDLRLAYRRLTTRPSHAVLSISILGLGLAAMLFLLTLVNGAILSPLPFPHSDRLVAIGEMRLDNNGIGGLSSEDYPALTRELKSYETIGTFAQMTVILSREQGAKRYQGAAISAEVLSLVGVQPVLGRAFTAQDDAPGAPPAVLLGHAVWSNDFSADPNIIGQAVRVNGVPGVVIGVMPEAFAFPVRHEVWVPRRLVAGDGLDAQIFARLDPDVTLMQARAELEAVVTNLGRDLRTARDDQRLVVKPWGMRFISESTRQVVWIMFSTGALLMLLACVNVANLQLSQTLVRRRELAVRSALGAGRLRLLRELLAESLLLSVSATAIALVLAELCSRWLVSQFIATDGAPPYYLDLSINLRMVAYGALAAFATTLLAGIVPALRAARTDVQGALRDGDKGSSGGGFVKAARGLVVAEIALTVVLLIGAGMFVRGLNDILAFDYGSTANATKVATGQVTLSAVTFDRWADRVRFFERVTERLRADPDVESATAANAMPGASIAGWASIAAEGEGKPEQGFRHAFLGTTDDHFLETYGISLRAGRYFDGRDVLGSERVAVVDVRLAEALWPGRDPLGQHVRVDPDSSEEEALTVVGVIGTTHLSNADDWNYPALLRPMRQHPQRIMTLAVRTRGSAEAFAPRLAEVVRGEDADTPVYASYTQQRAIQMGNVGPVVLTKIFTGVGLLALIMSAAGLYGVLAFSVAQRTREIGIRRAVGAGRREIVAAVGSRVFWQLVLGIGIGVALGLPWSGLLSGAMSYIHGYDPTVFVSVVSVVVLVAIVATLAPLRRAARVDPMIALRYE